MPVSDRKKIIIIGPAYPYRGGPSTYVSYIYEALKDRFNVKIYNYKLLYPTILFPGTTQFDRSSENKFETPNERILNSINPINWYLTSKRLKKENADLIVIDWWHPFFGLCHFFLTSFIKKKYKGKFLFITENFISHEKNKIDIILTRTGLKNADFFLALSETVVRELKEYFPLKKIYRSELPPFDLFTRTGELTRENTRKSFGYQKEDKVLLFFGYVRKYKGLDILIDAVKKVSDIFPEVKLLIVGEFYENFAKYKEQIKILGIEKKVNIRNEFVPNEQVAKFYIASDLVVLPYRSATQSAVLNVAYSFYKPVLVTNVGGLSEFVENEKTGIIVEPNSPDSLFNGIIKFFNFEKPDHFENNIKMRTGKSKFKELPELFNNIIKDSNK